MKEKKNSTFCCNKTNRPTSPSQWFWLPPPSTSVCQWRGAPPQNCPFRFVPSVRTILSDLFPFFFSIIFLTEIGLVKAPKKQWSKVRCAECRTESWQKSRKTWNVKNSFLSVQFSLVKTKVNLWTKNCGFGADYSRVWLAIIGSKIELKDFLFAKSHFMTVCSVLITHRALFAFLMRKSWNNESYGNMVLAESMRFSTG